MENKQRDFPYQRSWTYSLPPQDVARWQSGRPSYSPPAINTAKLQLLRVIIDEKHLKPSRNDFFTTQDIKIETQGDKKVDQDPQSWADDPQVGGEHRCRGSPQRGEESEPVSGSANRGVQHWDSEPPKLPALEASRTWIRESWRATRHRLCFSNFTGS